MSVPRLLAPGVVLFCFFSSCNKVDIPVVGSKLLVKVVETDGDTIMYTSFQYDAQKLLIATFDSSNNGFGSNSTFEYDTNGNLIKFIKSWHYPGVWNGICKNSSFLIYLNGKVIQKITNVYYTNNSDTSIYVVSNSYSYDNKGRLIRDYSSTEATTDFIYDGNDNVIQVHVLDPQLGVIGDWTTTDIYDSNINPYFGLGPNYYFVTNWGMLSKHNATQEITVQKSEFTYTVKNTYEYENGLPKKVTKNWDDSVIPGVPQLQGVYALEFYYN